MTILETGESELGTTQRSCKKVTAQDFEGDDALRSVEEEDAALGESEDGRC
jgi:hypothetical protein